MEWLLLQHSHNTSGQLSMSSKQQTQRSETHSNNRVVLQTSGKEQNLLLRKLFERKLYTFYSAYLWPENINNKKINGEY